MAAIRPRLRGRLHQVAFFVSIPAGAALVWVADTGLARLAAAVYALSLTGQYGASAAYHRLAVSPRTRLRLRRLDHSTIFVLIAGTYTPFALLVLEGLAATVVLVAVWTGAALGVVLKVAFFTRSTRLGGGLYVVLGWFVLLALPQLVAGLSGAQFLLLVAGGVLYSVGSVVLARRRPDPVPTIFGYHEVWHCFVVAAAVCHYLAILSVLRTPAS